MKNSNQYFWHRTYHCQSDKKVNYFIVQIVIWVYTEKCDCKLLALITIVMNHIYFYLEPLFLVILNCITSIIILFYKSILLMRSVVFSCKFTNSIYFSKLTGALLILSAICYIVSYYNWFFSVIFHFLGKYLLDSVKVSSKSLTLMLTFKKE